MKTHRLIGSAWLVASAVSMVSPSVADVITHYQYTTGGLVAREYVEDTDLGRNLADTRSQYDELGRAFRVRQVASAEGQTNDSTDRVTTTAYDWRGNVKVVTRKATATAGRDAVSTYEEYDAANRLGRKTDERGGVTVYQRDGRGNPIEITDPAGNLTVNHYDAAGRKDRVEQYEGDFITILTTVTKFDSRGNRIRETAYNARATPEGDDDIPLKQERWDYDDLGRITVRAQMADPTSDAAFDQGVDAVTRLTYLADTKRVASTTSYSAGSEATAATTTYQYDERRRLDTTTDPEGNVEDRWYVGSTPRLAGMFVNEPGQVVAYRIFGYGPYDAYGRLEKVTANGFGDAQPVITTYQYDGLNRQTRVTMESQGGANTIATEYVYNTFGEQTQTIEDEGGPLERKKESNYDQLGRLVSEKVWDSEQVEQETQYQYDLSAPTGTVGRSKRVAFPGDTTSPDYWAFDYDAAGRLTRRTDARPTGGEITYTRNRLDQVLTKTVEGQAEETFEYDPLGRMTLAKRNEQNKVVQEYDGFGRLHRTIQTVAGITKQTAADYDQAGNRTRLYYPVGAGVYRLQYTHDKLGQTKTISRQQIIGAPMDLLAEYVYGGRYMTDRSVRAKPNTALGTTVDLHIDYDIHRRRTAISNWSITGGLGTLLDEYTRIYDWAGDPDTGTAAGHEVIEETQNYTYDTLHRLDDVSYDGGLSSEDFAYDLQDSRTSYENREGETTEYDHNVVNEYTTITPPGELSPVPVVYDEAGNLIQSENGFLFTYDYENRVTKVCADLNENGISDPGEELAAYTYDALGRRITETREGQTTRLYYDGDNVLAEYDPWGVVERYYVHGPTYVDEHVVLNEKGVDYVYLLGFLDSATGLARGNGEVVERYTYDAYGLPTRHDFGAAGPIFGDHNNDGHIDGYDAAQFDTCQAGSPPIPRGCGVFDYDGNNALDHNDLGAFLSVYDQRNGDYDRDWDVDLSDFAEFGPCYSGPGGNGVAPACYTGDFNGDGRVDLWDYAAFQWQFTRALESASGPKNRYLFSGRRLDFDIRDGENKPLLALYHYRARAYDPVHGRFLQRDPAQYADAMNLYDYVTSNPLMLTDPTGNFSLLDLLSGFTTRPGLQMRAAAVSGTAMGLFGKIAEAMMFRSQMLTGMINAVSRWGQRGVDYLVRANQIMQGTAGRVFNTDNYRSGYIWLRGTIDKASQVHHIFPQAFEKFFAQRGINIHIPLWLQEIEIGLHQRLGYVYNARWEAWKDMNPSATIDEIFAFGRVVMMEVYGIPAPF